MSSPNDPGYPGDGPGDGNGNGNGLPGNGFDGAPNGPADHGDVPPWERGASRGRPAQRTKEPTPRPEGGRGNTATGQSPVDARINRFMSGGPASPPRDTSPPIPTREAPPREAPPKREAPVREPAAAREPASPVREPEPVRPEAYASELPDLSSPAPRAGQRRSAGEQAAADPPARSARGSARTQVINKTAGPVRASMQIRRLDPWSVLKVSLVLSVALFFVWMIAVAFLYLVLGAMGVWSKLNSNVGDLLTSASGSGGELVSSGTIFGGALLIGLVNIVLLTAMATCGAFIYNLTTDIVGGIEVTLADRD